MTCTSFHERRRTARMQDPTYREEYERVYREIRLLDSVAHRPEHTEQSSESQQDQR